MMFNFYKPTDKYGYLHQDVPLLIKSFEKCDELLSLMTCDIESTGVFLEELEGFVSVIEKKILELLCFVMYPNKLKEISLNMPILVKRLMAIYQDGRYDEFAMKMQCEFRPLFLSWEKVFNFYFVQCINDERMNEYNAIEVQQISSMAKEPKKDETTEHKYDLSIVVLFYGKKEMTKDCIDAIHKYTKGYTYELITFDNGSDEDTTQWCNSLPHFKKVHYPVNIGSSAAGNTIIYYSKEYIEGRFLVFVANDVIVTENWAESLYQCMLSDESIIWATPITNSLSNMQTIPVPYQNNNLEEMFSFASNYNKFDPLKWDERARLFLAMGIIRQNEVAKFNDFGSPYFCYDMFCDDDTSIRYKRAGYKQILCSDVFIHHYGSATIGESQYQVMDIGRDQFYKKYGVDAWVGITDISIVFSNFINGYTADSIKVLSIEPKFGEGTFSLKNKFRKIGCREVNIDAITSNYLYLPDMHPVYDNSFLITQYNNNNSKKEYDFIFYNSYLEDDNFMLDYIKLAQKRLKNGGTFMFAIKNFYSYNNLNHIFNITSFIDKAISDVNISPKTSFTTVQDMRTLVQKCGLMVNSVIPVEHGTKNMENLKKINLNLIPDFYEITKYDSFTFICTK